MTCLWVDPAGGLDEPAHVGLYADLSMLHDHCALVCRRSQGSAKDQEIPCKCSFRRAPSDRLELVSPSVRCFGKLKLYNTQHASARSSRATHFTMRLCAISIGPRCSGRKYAEVFCKFSTAETAAPTAKTSD